MADETSKVAKRSSGVRRIMTRMVERWGAIAALLLLLFAMACGEGDGSGFLGLDDEDPSEKTPFAHIKPQPPGGKWIGRAKNRQNFFREFKKTGTIYLVGVSLTRLIAVAHDAEPKEVVIGKKTASLHVDAVVRPKDRSRDTAREMLRSLITERLGLVVEYAPATRMTMVLERAPGGVVLEPSASTEGMLQLVEGELRSSGSRISQLVELVGKDSLVPVVDETGLIERYDYLLQWDKKRGAYAFIQALGDIGLTLNPAQRRVDSLVVREAKFLDDAKDVDVESIRRKTLANQPVDDD